MLSKNAWNKLTPDEQWQEYLNAFGVSKYYHIEENLHKRDEIDKRHKAKAEFDEAVYQLTQSGKSIHEIAKEFNVTARVVEACMWRATYKHNPRNEIGTLGLTTRVYNSLMRANIITYAELIEFTKNPVPIRNLGTTGFSEIVESLKRNNFI